MRLTCIAGQPDFDPDLGVQEAMDLVYFDALL